MVIKNAIIESASLTKADYNLLSAWLFLDYGNGGHQGFGGHSLYLPTSFKHHEKGASYAGHFIFRCLEVADVEKWEQLKGKTIRVQLDNDGIGGKIEAIGHIVKDDWFNPTTDFSKI